MCACACARTRARASVCGGGGHLIDGVCVGGGGGWGHKIMTEGPYSLKTL